MAEREKAANTFLHNYYDGMKDKTELSVAGTKM